MGNKMISEAVMRLTRRQVLAAGGVFAAAMALPGGLRRAVAATAGFDYYIGPNGSDSNAGTQASPWAITALNSKRTTYAGKRVGMLDGTYNLVDILGQPSGPFDTNQLLVQGGTAASPTILQSVNLHGAIIDGDRPRCTTGAECGLIGPHSSYLVFDGLKLIRANYRAITNTLVADYFTVQNCWFNDQVFEVGTGGGKNSATLFMQRTVGSMVSNCRFEQAGSPIDTNRHAFVQFYEATDCVVEYCTIIGNATPPSGNGVHFKDVNNKHLTVRNCFIDQTNSTNSFSKECILWHGNGGTDGKETCHHNVLIAGNYAAPLCSEGNSSSWDIYNNTIIGNPKYSQAGLDHLELGSPTINVYNNIFSRQQLGSRGDMSLPAIGRIGNVDYNLYDSSPALQVQVAGSTTAGSLSAWQTLSGKESHSQQTADPLFVGTGVDAAKWQLQSTSPAKKLGAGSTEIGAWAGQTQIGCDFSGAAAAKRPSSPTLDKVT